ncbi:MAG TPA: hypothetical protein DEF34_10190 [Desulfotomaculum sp.]|nr:MAG: hypothetical protein JL56_05865 [Desulfotomaculum sp. BICA1-6]HBX23983.1 hypothetical protein [Desulfotomaculum sp.]
MKDIIDSILGPIQQFLNFSIEKIQGIQLVAERGLNLNYYLGPITHMGSGWVALCFSLISSIVLLAVVFLARSGYSLYLNFKEGVKWW